MDPTSGERALIVCFDNGARRLRGPASARGEQNEAPLHVHHREDEAFYILEGSATIHVGDESFDVGPGDYAFGPRDVPHRYSIGDEGCRFLFICTPGGGFESLVRAMSVPAERRTLPPPADEEPDWEHVAAVAEAHGCKLLA